MTDNVAADSAHFFLSYSRTDERFALRLARDLRGQGVAMWVDQLDIRPSEHWDRAIERAVTSCRGLLVILSPRSVASENVADEISFAIDNGKSVLPVMIEKCVLPLRITRMHVVDATRNYDRALQQCLAELCHPSRQPTPSSEAIRKTIPPLDPSAVAAAKRQLATFIGPIASILVDKAALDAASIKDLYSFLAPHIDSEAERERFLTMAGNSMTPTPPSFSPTAESAPSGAAEISPDELNSISSALTQYLGPIAPLVARRESRSCTSAADLRQRLAALIPAEQDRTDFLRRVTG